MNKLSTKSELIQKIESLSATDLVILKAFLAGMESERALEKENDETLPDDHLVK